MTLVRSLLGLTLVAALGFGVFGSAVAQRRGFIPPNPQALPVLQQDLIGAIESMKSALPIYDGNRVRSIRAAHAALVLVDQAISGVNAKVRPQPNVKDEITNRARQRQKAHRVRADLCEPGQHAKRDGNIANGLERFDDRRRLNPTRMPRPSKPRSTFRRRWRKGEVRQWRFMRRRRLGWGVVVVEHMDFCSCGFSPSPGSVAGSFTDLSRGGER